MLRHEINESYLCSSTREINYFAGYRFSSSYNLAKALQRSFCHQEKAFLLACPGILSRDSAWLAWIRPNKYAGICSSFIRCQNRIRQSMHQKQPIHHTLILTGCKENQSKCYIITDKYMNNSKSDCQSNITTEISNKHTTYFCM